MTVGFALVWLVVPIVGKRVFLRVVSTIPTVMHGMTTAAATVKKAAFGRSKSPPLAVKKQLRIEALPQTLLKSPPHPFQGAGSYSCCVLGGYVVLLPPWGRLGWGFYVGWCAPLATPSELLLLAGRCLHVLLPLLLLTGCSSHVLPALLPLRRAWLRVSSSIYCVYKVMT